MGRVRRRRTATMAKREGSEDPKDRSEEAKVDATRRESVDRESLSFELPFPGYLFLAQKGKVLGNYPVI